MPNSLLKCDSNNPKPPSIEEHSYEKILKIKLNFLIILDYFNLLILKINLKK